jgi:DNA polymerase-3 subunit gamma/tau
MVDQSLELYKRYRPRDWSRIIGQGKAVKSLQGAVAANKVPTAYVFAGDRGCGKTSAAFVMAKAVNCPNVENGNPCNHCDVCNNIDAGSQIGVNYISMANKGSAEDIREIVQQARLATSINRQVWILDEVHNLSKQAFDALLIPLEDPKMPSLFILCTTEIHKVPQTIMSRVQSRKFSLVGKELMGKYIAAVVKKEGLELTEEDISTVIRMGRGSVRDTLSALEQISETGETFANYGGRLLEALCAQQLGGVLAVIAEASTEDSVKGRELGEQLFQDLRDLMLAASGADRSLFPSLPLEDPKKAAADLLGLRGLSIVLDEVGDALTRMTLGADSRVQLEIAVVKSLQKLKQLKARMER